MVDGTSRPLYPRERSGCVRGWVGLGADLNGYRKSRRHGRFEPETVQSVASRYTDCAIQAPSGNIGPMQSNLPEISAVYYEIKSKVL
jgi:hypothetical protein